jgi:cyclin G-associated kinase
LLDIFGSQMAQPTTVKNSSNQQNLQREDLFMAPTTVKNSSNQQNFQREDLFSDFTAPPPPQAATSKHVTSSSNNIDCLLDISGGSGTPADFLNPSPPMMKTSSSAENFKAVSSGAAAADPFGDLLGLKPTPIMASNSNTTPKMSSSPVNSRIPVAPVPAATAADDLLSKMLGDLDMKPKTKPVNTGKQQQSTAGSRPNYNVSFNNGKNSTTSAATASSSSTTKKSSFSSNFEDLLGPNFNVNNGGAAGSGNSGKSIGEMKKKEEMKTMTPEEAQVFAWKDGKTRNIRALLCSLHTVIWPDSRWKQCGMHQLVNENDVRKMYQRACLAVHPDRQMGSPNEEMSKLIFMELNDAWAEFKKDS